MVNIFPFLARLNEVQKELLHYPPVVKVAAAVSAFPTCLSFYVKVFYVMGKAELQIRGGIEDNSRIIFLIS